MLADVRRDVEGRVTVMDRMNVPEEAHGMLAAMREIKKEISDEDVE